MNFLGGLECTIWHKTNQQTQEEKTLQYKGSKYTRAHKARAKQEGVTKGTHGRHKDEAMCSGTRQIMNNTDKAAMAEPWQKHLDLKCALKHYLQGFVYDFLILGGKAEDLSLCTEAPPKTVRLDTKKISKIHVIQQNVFHNCY